MLEDVITKVVKKESLLYETSGIACIAFLRCEHSKMP